MTELATTLAAIADLDLVGSHARAAAVMLRDRLAHGAPAERATALVVIADLEGRAARNGGEGFPGACATPL